MRLSALIHAPLRDAILSVKSNPGCHKKRSARDLCPDSPPGCARRRRARTFTPGTRGKRFEATNAPRRWCEDWLPCSPCIPAYATFLIWTAG